MEDSIEQKPEETVAKTVDCATIANYFNVTTRSIGKWVNHGMPRQGREVYNVRECIEWYVQREVQEALRNANGRSYVDSGMAKIRKEVAEAELKEIEVAQARNVLVNIEDAERELERQLTPVRNALLGFPKRIAPFLVMVPDELQSQQLLDDHIRDLMDNLANRVDEPITENEPVEEEPTEDTE